MKRRYFISGITAGLMLAIAGFYCISGFPRQEYGGYSYREAPYVFTGADSETVKLQNTFVNIAKAVKPSVVQITTEKTVTQRYWNPFGDFEDFFRSPFDSRGPRQREPRTFERKQQGLGSGFIVDEEGYIITNYHVIKDVDKILVALKDDMHKYEAEVIGNDSKTDLALIKIKAKRPLPAVKLGDSDAIEPGEWVMAIGNPMGLYATVTVGVISAKGRSGFNITQYEDFIQTDAAINPGNSGGPLINVNAEVVGINTFIMSPQVAENIGFAIPVNMAKNVFTQLREKGRVVRGYLGVRPQSLDEDLAESFGLKEAKGALIAEVLPDTPAEKAGIKEGDIIISFDGREVEDGRDLSMKAADAHVGKKVRITVWRDKQKVEISLVIGERPSDEKLADFKDGASWRGMKVSDVTEEIKDRYGIEDGQGVAVTFVEEGSPSSEAGIVPGIIILEIDGRKIRGMKDYNEAVKTVPEDKDVRLRIKQGNLVMFILIKSEK